MFTFYFVVNPLAKKWFVLNLRSGLSNPTRRAQPKPGTDSESIPSPLACERRLPQEERRRRPPPPPGWRRIINFWPVPQLSSWLAPQSRLTGSPHVTAEAACGSGPHAEAWPRRSRWLDVTVAPLAAAQTASVLPVEMPVGAAESRSPFLIIWNPFQLVVRVPNAYPEWHDIQACIPISESCSQVEMNFFGTQWYTRITFIS